MGAAPPRIRPEDFRFIQRLVGERAGIHLADSKRDMVSSRLFRRARMLKLSGIDAYVELLREGDESELKQFENVITTNVTAFFRHEHQFEHLATKTLPAVRAARSRDRRVRVWSAACSSGPEPYSIAMVAHESFGGLSGWDFKILATDLDSDILARAKAGVYQAEQIRGVSKARKQKWFRKESRGDDASYRIAAEVRQLVTFKQLNLIGGWPMKGPFDVVFCRNVVIYFSLETQRVLYDRIANLMRIGGTLFVGQSESLHSVTTRFRLIGGCVYEKIS